MTVLQHTSSAASCPSYSVKHDSVNSERSSGVPGASELPTKESSPEPEPRGDPSPPRKRPRTTIDVLDRLTDRHASTASSSTTSKARIPDLQSGRGCLTGWVTCPLCAPVSQKRYALGRGIATHLQCVHQPWNPGRAERKRRERLRQRRAAQARQERGDYAAATATIQGGENHENDEERAPWEPTQQEVDAWKAEMLQLLQHIEAQAAAATDRSVPSTTTSPTESQHAGGAFAVTVLPAGTDRRGDASVQYRQSLPEFLRAAADGNLAELRAMVDAAQSSGGAEAVRALLDTRDRHLSTADHWAAGSGHLKCLQFLVETRDSLIPPADAAAHPAEGFAPDAAPSKLRRRDGKTALHYAARNGHQECIRYLVREALHPVDEASGDGTTPLHMACFGGHAPAFELLVELGADPHRRNDWGCTAAHWVAMTKSQSKDDVWRFCDLVARLGVSFVEPQKQGHTALHKAAQRKNRLVIQWMASSKADGGAGLSPLERRVAGSPDDGGHEPSKIWLSVKGDIDFADWMRKTMQW